MPDPIQSSTAPNQSYYDPSEQVSRAPEAAACSAPPPPPAPAPAAPTTPGGQDVLIKKYGGGVDCNRYAVSAGISLAVAGASAAIGIATARSGGGVAGMIGVIGGIAKGAADLANYLNCEDRNERMQAAAEECNQSGGTLFAGAGDSEAVCVVPRQ